MVLWLGVQALGLSVWTPSHHAPGSRSTLAPVAFSLPGIYIGLFCAFFPQVASLPGVSFSTPVVEEIIPKY